MIVWLNEKIVEVTSLLRGAAVVVAVAMVLYAYARTRSLVTLLMAALTAGIFLWTVNNPGWWQQRVEEETLGRSRVVVVAGELGGEEQPPGQGWDANGGHA